MKDDNNDNSLIGFITANFYRLANSETVDNKALLILIAAIGMLNIDDDQAQSAAKRLATLAMSKTKIKKDKS